MRNKVLTLWLFISVLPSLVCSQNTFEEMKREQEKAFRRARQNSEERYTATQHKQQAAYDAFRRKANERYATFMKERWNVFSSRPVIEKKKEKEIPPVIYHSPQPKDTLSPSPTPRPIPMAPVVVEVPKPVPSPEPIAPVVPKEEVTVKKTDVLFYGTKVQVSFPEHTSIPLSPLSEPAVAHAWLQLSQSNFDRALSEALQLRQQLQLCDWAYMEMVGQLAQKRYGQTNVAVLVQAYFLSQSGYRIRLGMDQETLYLLMASDYDICDIPYYELDGGKFYPIHCEVRQMQICEAKFESEKPFSLQIATTQGFAIDSSEMRQLRSHQGLEVAVRVNKNMMDFYNHYPTAYINGDVTTRWAAYANTPLENEVRELLYPELEQNLKGKTQEEAVTMLLHWVQTAFVYQYDDSVWGEDRVFFPSETLYYPYSDCEDRAILFSRLVRDLLHREVVLLYYPGHLAAAVHFDENVTGDYLVYNGKKYVVCDPTYIHAGIGRTMPGMNNQEAKVVVL